MNDLVSNNSTTPALMSPALSRLVDDLRRGLRMEGDRYSVSPRMAATAEQRGMLKQRLALINDWLAPAGGKYVEAEIAAVFGVMAVDAESLEDRRIRMRIYVSDLQDLPAFAVSHACAAARRGEIGDGVYAPKVAVLRGAAREKMRAFEIERADIRRVLDADVVEKRPPTPQAQARVNRLVAEVAAAAHAAIVHDRVRFPAAPVARDARSPPTETDAEMTARLRERCAEPPAFSEEFVSKFGAAKRQDAAE